MTDSYARLAAVLWFLPSHAIEDLLDVAEDLAVESFRESLNG